VEGSGVVKTAVLSNRPAVEVGWRELVKENMFLI
jgi:hypothetical protein